MVSKTEHKLLSAHIKNKSNYKSNQNTVHNKKLSGHASQHFIHRIQQNFIKENWNNFQTLKLSFSFKTLTIWHHG